MFKQIIAGSVLAASVLASVAAYADASIMMFPQNVKFEKGQKTATVTLLNRGDATGLYELSFIDKFMTEDGGLVDWDEKEKGSKAPWTLANKARFSPRRVQLAPGQSQIIKIALRPRGKVDEKEYASHLKILVADGNIDKKLDEDLLGADGQKNEAKVAVQTRQAMAIPVIWKNTTEAAKTSLGEAKIAENMLDVTIKREGVASSRGLLRAKDSKGEIIGAASVVIYPNLEKKISQIAINEPYSAAQLKGQKITLQYVDEDDDTVVLFEDSVQL